MLQGVPKFVSLGAEVLKLRHGYRYSGLKAVPILTKTFKRKLIFSIIARLKGNGHKAVDVVHGFRPDS
jgi:hypothetical protein